MWQCPPLELGPTHQGTPKQYNVIALLIGGEQLVVVSDWLIAVDDVMRGCWDDWIT